MFDRNGSRKYLNAAERKAYFRAVEGETDILKRSFCLTLLLTGCRISEALNLTRDRVDLSDKCVVLETLKRRKRGMYRVVPVSDDLLSLLSEVTRGMEPAERLWKFSRTTGYRTVKRLTLSIGITGKMNSPKGLRHGFGVACVGNKIPLSAIKKWLGHARLETTAIYLDVSGEEDRDLASRLWFSR